MKKKINTVINFVIDVFMTYSLFVLMWIAVDFLFEIPIICAPILVLALAFKVIPMVSKKKDGEEK